MSLFIKTFTLFEIIIINSFSVYGDFWENFEEISRPPPQSIGALPRCGEGTQGEFKCVPYFNCDPLTNTIVDYPEVDGSNFISPRTNDGRCASPLEVCCQTNQTDSSFEHVATVDLQFEAKCGIKNEGNSVWMVALLSLDNELLCGGSLLNAAIVLTAAHCVINVQPQKIKVRAGQWDLGSTASGQERNVSEIIIHQHFWSMTLYNDIAILILDRSFQADKNVNSICIPTSQTMATDNCFVASWAKTQPNETSFSTLLKKNHSVALITKEECQKRYREVIREFVLDRTFICAHNTSGSVCKGDGGGPLVCADSSQHYFQVGIVSWGIKCDNSLPEVYTNVVEYRDWLDEIFAMLGYKSSSYTQS